MTMQRLLGRLWIIGCCISTLVWAEEVTIDIIGGNKDQRYPIAFEGFEGESDGCLIPLTPIIKNNLLITGFFHFAPTHLAKATLAGRIEKTLLGQCKISFTLRNAQHQVLLTEQITIGRKSAHKTAHHIADKVYYTLSGFAGIFDSRIAYIKRFGKTYVLEIANVDGSQPQVILRSQAPIISPAWSPDGKKLAYVSFEQQKPVVYVQPLPNGKRQAIANFQGSNSAPAWSPDGKQLAVTLTFSGHSQIYLINADGSNRRQLTQSTSIDTEASWSPDGQSLIFVSDRSGRPQIYQIAIQGGIPKRLTFDGNYNVSPKISPDNKSFAYISRKNGRFLVMIQDFDSRFPRLLSESYFNERPSFSPNGQLVLYASEDQGKSVLHAATIDGGARTRIGMINHSIQDPAWGPIG
ncbi:MAG: Tol-Pal system beta propeller repeat protein TolB [Neisseriales bacterium]|nr:MAG: Tol-Pal system beta propeller repeat protein TolB [Neisseriales bacterium]